MQSFYYTSFAQQSSKGEKMPVFSIKNVKRPCSANFLAYAHCAHAAHKHNCKDSLRDIVLT